MKKAFSSSRRQRCLCLLLIRAWVVTRDNASSFSFVESLLIATRSTTSIGRLGQAQHHKPGSPHRRGGGVFVSKNNKTYPPPIRRSSVARQRFGRLQAYDSRTTMTTDHASGKPPFPPKLYQISSILMATVALLLLLYFPQMSSSSSSSIDTNTFVTRWQRSQFNLGTQFGAASGFGMAAYLFYWLGGTNNPTSKEESGAITQPLLPARLSRLLHLALILFCGVGMWAIPGEAGLLRRTIVDMPLEAPLRSKVITSFLVSLLSTIARGVGLWTAIWGWKDLKDNNTCTLILHDDEEEPGEEADESDGSLDKATDKRLLDFPADMFVASRIFQVSKRHRKHGALFYRNVLLLVFCGIGSNIMDIIFQLRYQNAASFSFSATDISLKISAVARQWMIATLLYGLKVGSEILPPLGPTTTKPKTMMDRRDEFDEMKRQRLKSQAKSNDKPGESKMAEEEESKTNKNDDGTNSQLFLERKEHSKSLTKSMTRINLLVATWPLLIFYGQNLTSFLLPGSWSPTGIPYLVVSGLFALKAYRFHLYGENKEEGGPPRLDEL